MDRFGVPNKVNRHVTKAIKAIRRKKGSSHEESVTFSEIFSEVQQSMRNLRPTKNLSGCVRKSLKNMENSSVVIVHRKGTKLGYTLAQKSSKLSRTMFPNVVSFELRQETKRTLFKIPFITEFQ